MPGSLVEYARFVEVQRRRARITAELLRPPLPPAPLTEPMAIEPFLEIDEPVTSVDANPTRGTIDVR